MRCLARAAMREVYARVGQPLLSVDISRKLAARVIAKTPVLDNEDSKAYESRVRKILTEYTREHR